MRDSVLSRLNRLEKTQNTLPHAIVTFLDGHKELLDLHDIAAAFFEKNQKGIISVDWERPGNNSAIFQVLSSPDLWENLL